MKHNDWTDKLYDRLSDHKAGPPVGLWDKIESSLDKKKKRARVVHMRMWAAAAAAMLLLVIGLGYKLNEPTIAELDRMNSLEGGTQGRPDNVVAQRRDDASVSDTPDAPETMAVAQTSGRTVVPSAGLLAELGDKEAVGNDAGQIEKESGRIEKEAVSENAAVNKEETKVVGSDRSDNRAEKGNVSTGNRVFPEQVYHEHGAKRENSKWAVGAYSSNVLGNSNSMNGVNMVSKINALYAMTENMLRANSSAFSDNKEDKKHYQPISFGLTANYALTDRISLTSGLVYTKLSSDFIHISDGEEAKDSQTLHYLGVPLNVNYNVWSTNRFKTYVTLGGQADFNVSAKVETEGVKTSLNKDRVQFSLNAAAGAQYDIIPQLGVYVEPGVRYYIDNGSVIENYFKDKPLGFSLQLGLRLNIK